MNTQDETHNWLNWPKKQPELSSQRLNLRPFEPEDASTVQRLDKEYWNNGYCTEAAKIMIDFALKHTP